MLKVMVSFGGLGVKDNGLQPNQAEEHAADLKAES